MADLSRKGIAVSIDPRVLIEMPAEPLASLAEQIRDGDLLLCSATDPFSRLIGWSTKSPWTHVGFAWRWPEVGRILAVECVQHIGVHAVAMERFLRQTSSGTHPYSGKIILARHAELARMPQLDALAEDAVDLMGSRFSPGEIVKIATRIAFGRFDRHTPNLLRATTNSYVQNMLIVATAASGLLLSGMDGASSRQLTSRTMTKSPPSRGFRPISQAVAPTVLSKFFPKSRYVL